MSEWIKIIISVSAGAIIGGLITLFLSREQRQFELKREAYLNFRRAKRNFYDLIQFPFSLWSATSFDFPYSEAEIEKLAELVRNACIDIEFCAKPELQIKIMEYFKLFDINVAQIKNAFLKIDVPGFLAEEVNKLDPDELLEKINGTYNEIAKLMKKELGINK